MSIAFLLDNKDEAVVWRGPKKSGTIYIEEVFIEVQMVLIFVLLPHEVVRYFVIHLKVVSICPSICLSQVVSRW